MYLRRWLDEPGGREAEQFLFTVIGDRITSKRWETLCQWCDESLGNSRSQTFLLGSLLPGEIVADGVSGQGCLLAGENVAKGHSSADVATFLEALAMAKDMAIRSAELATKGFDYGCLAQAFLAGYGSYSEQPLVAKATVLRRLKRLIDVAAHLGWYNYLADQATALVDLIDSQGYGLIEWVSADVSVGCAARQALDPPVILLGPDHIR